MSYQPCDSEKSKKKSKKVKRRPKKTESTKFSQDVDPPTTINKPVNSTTLKWNQEEPRACDPYEDGDYEKMPYEAPNEVNFIGGIGANTGHRRSKKFINRTTKIQQIYNMRHDNKTVFNFCEDPRLTHNLPSRGQTNENDELITDTVRQIGAIKHEQLPIKEAADPSTDLEHYTDSNTNSNDNHIADNKHNNLEIRKQFLDQKRMLLKEQLETEVEQKLGNEYRKEKFKLSEYFDIDKNIPEDLDMESVREVHVDWSEKYKVEAHVCDLKFGRHMPEVIPMPLETEKLAFLTRTLDKPRNIEKLEQEIRKYTKPIEENVNIDYTYRETARKLEKILKKQKLENFSIELAIKDFDEFMNTSVAFNVSGSEVDTNIDTADVSQKEKRKSAIKHYEEEKIYNQLSEPEETSSPNIHTSIEDPELTANIDGYRKVSSSHQEINLPIDFTYAFDTRQNEIRKSEPKNKAKIQGQYVIERKVTRSIFRLYSFNVWLEIIRATEIEIFENIFRYN